MTPPGDTELSDMLKIDFGLHYTLKRKGAAKMAAPRNLPDGDLSGELLFETGVLPRSFA